MATLDILTVTFNSPALGPHFSELSRMHGVKLWVVDNASKVEPSYPTEATLIQATRNLGFGRACNEMLTRGSAEYILFLNPDCIATPETIERMLRLAVKIDSEHSSGCVVGAVARGRDGQKVIPAGAEPSAKSLLVQYLGLARYFGGGFNMYAASVKSTVQSVAWLGGGAMLMSRSLFIGLGGFSSRYFLYGEDVELCLRARDAGAQVVLDGGALVYHPVGTGSQASESVRFAWMRNLRVLVADRRGPAGRRRLDAVLWFGAVIASAAKLAGRSTSVGRPGVRALWTQVMKNGKAYDPSSPLD